MVIQRIDITGDQPRRVFLRAEQKLRAGEQATDRRLHATLESHLSTAELVQIQQFAKLLFARLPPVGTARQPGKYLFGTGHLIRGGRWHATEYPAP